jgi:BclB C-terminal domain-containing protein
MEKTGFWYYSSSLVEWVRLADINEVSTSTIIPFASGDPVPLYAKPFESYPRSAAIGFGDLAKVTDESGVLVFEHSFFRNVAFVMPTDGVITSLAGSFNLYSDAHEILPTSSLVVKCAIYIAPAGSVIFSLLEGVSIDLAPHFDSQSTSSQVSTGRKSNLSIPVSAGSRLTMVFTVFDNSVSSELSFGLLGHASGGLTIRSR